MTKETDEKFGRQEARERFERTLRGALKTPPKPLKDVQGKRPVAPDGTKDSDGAPTNYSAPRRPPRS